MAISSKNDPDFPTPDRLGQDAISIDIKTGRVSVIVGMGGSDLVQTYQLTKDLMGLFRFLLNYSSKSFIMLLALQKVNPYPGWDFSEIITIS